MTKFLASAQCTFLGAWALSHLVGHPFATWIAFIPLECLLFIAAIFWALFILGVNKLR